MPGSMIRAHVVIPKELVESIDRLVGRRARSRFLTEAAEREVRRRRLAASMHRAAGSLVGTETPPDWETAEGAAEWVRRSRAEDDVRLARRLKEP